MPWLKFDDGKGGTIVAHVKMARRPRKRCKTCAVLGCELECDGCDKPLCSSCAVSPKEGVDCCPSCAAPAWRHWLQLQPASIAAMERMRRRNEFRRWARAAADVFLGLVPLGAVARKAAT